MPWCPKCRLEYQEGFTKCNDCGTDLVDHLELIQEPIEEYDKEAYLTSASNSIEADVLEALLESNGIPVLRKFREAGGYLEIYMGGSNFGVDLYVPSKLLETAKGIISTKPEMFEETAELNSFQKDEEESFDKLVERSRKKRLIFYWLIILIFCPGLLIIALMIVYSLFHWLTNIF